MPGISDNLRSVMERIDAAARRSGRGGDQITLVTVTKTRSVAEIREALACGVTDVGENYVQEAQDKFAEIGGAARWHMIGHLQRNKVKRALEIFQRLDAVDSIRLAEEISVRSTQRGVAARILIEVNTSGEERKFGVAPEGARELALRASQMPNVAVEGLMTMAPFTEDMDVCRICFGKLREIAQRIRADESATLRMRHLSMGMTQDYEVAVEEGATMVRIGTAIFKGLNP
jgi:hypothetical protein